MGSLMSALANLFASNAKLEVALVGLENSGKTTLAEFLCTGSKGIASFPTVGLNVKMMKKQGVSIKMWDMSGQERFRREWPRYVDGTNCIVFCVDSSEINRITTARDELHRLMTSSTGFSSLPLLLCLTKYDLSPRISVEDAIQLLGLERLPKSVSWVVVPCSSVSGLRMGEVVDWLVKHKQKA